VTIPIAPGAAAGSQTWRDRRRAAAYTSPSNTRIEFEYIEVSREIQLRTARFEFPGINNAYVQQNGFGARQYPMRCYFLGDQHDLIATAFEAALCEAGSGKLEHPLYGTITVVPTDTIRRLDNPRDEANQSIVEVTFSTTTGAIYPSVLRDAQNEILSALDGFDVAAAQQFNASLNLTSVGKKSNFLATVKKQLALVSGAMSEASSAVTTVRQGFADAMSTLNFGLDVLVGQPLLLAQQISNVIKAPGRAASGIESRMDAYENLAVSIFGSKAANPSSDLSVGSQLSERTTRAANDFHTADLFALCSVGGLINACVADPISDSNPTGTFAGQARPRTSRTFQTRPQALAAAERILTLFDASVAWRDERFTLFSSLPGVSAGQTDTGEAYQALRNAAALSAGLLIETSFSLVPEKSKVLDRPRTIIDLCAELYGVVDSKLDFLIQTNNLTGDEIKELPAGREVKYYPS
jgi:hypothetical protein